MMIDINNINDNVISNRWEQRYAQLTDEKKEKIRKLNESNAKDYQLQVIKRKRIYPEIGDVFQLQAVQDITLYGVVVNNHVKNLNGDELLVVLIFKPHLNLREVIREGIANDDLLISPVLVGREYWARGYFYNIDHIDHVSLIKNYGFYNIGKRQYVDEYGNRLLNEPELLGAYGVATAWGIAMEVNQELIIADML